MQVSLNSHIKNEELREFLQRAYEVPQEDLIKFNPEQNQSELGDWMDFDYLVDYVKKHGAIVEVRSDDGELIGAAVVAKQHPISWPDGRKMEIFALAVSPEHRRSGVGSALLGAINRVAVDLGAHSILVNTHIFLQSARNFYKKNGYISKGTVQDYYENGAAIFLIKSVGDMDD
jgi:ribosomal protein S18 acetylase RimI-like enzyme